MDGKAGESSNTESQTRSEAGMGTHGEQGLSLTPPWAMRPVGETERTRPIGWFAVGRMRSARGNDARPDSRRTDNGLPFPSPYPLTLNAACFLVTDPLFKSVTVTWIV